MTVVRRPLQSMVCSGRLTICDQKCMAGPEIVYVAMNRAHVLSREPLQALRDQLRLAGRFTNSFPEAVQWNACLYGIAHFIDVFNGRSTPPVIKHA